MGAIKHISMGPTIEHTLDYRRNPGTDFLATDLTTTSLSKVTVLDAASYTPGELSVPIVWSKADEAKNSSENQKVALVKNLIENAITSHDDALEEALFGTSDAGFLGIQTLLPDSGQGTVGGINSATDAWWRNQFGNYAAAGTDIESALTTAWNAAAKSTGGQSPDLLVAGQAPHALYEGSQQGLIRYENADTANAGFKKLMFKTAGFIFSQHGPADHIYGIPCRGGKSFKLNVSKEYFRDKGETMEIPNANGFVCKLYSMLQLTTNNKSRGFVLIES
jgi:hypothetical protein